MQDNFAETISQKAQKILDTLKTAPSMSSWDIKLKLRLSSSLLYLSLGKLVAENKISVAPEDLNYRVKLRE